jgi:general stress protein 26
MKPLPQGITSNQFSSEESKERIYEFLKEHTVGVLATVDPDNNPYASTIYYSIDEDFNLYFTTKKDTQKSDNITHNNKVMVVVSESFTQSTAQFTGFAEIVTDESDVFEIFTNTVHAAMKTSEAGVPPISKLYAGSYVAYKIKPEHIRLAVFLRPDPGGYDVYETADFSS